VFGRLARLYLVLHLRDWRKGTFQRIFKGRPQWAIEAMLQNVETPNLGVSRFDHRQAWGRAYDMSSQVSERLDLVSRLGLLFSV
jgi:hypothetical protein